MQLEKDGIGNFVYGSFPVPQNPLMRGPRGMGFYVPGSFIVPQNPLRGDTTLQSRGVALHDRKQKQNALAVSLSSLGCGCCPDHTQTGLQGTFGEFVTSAEGYVTDFTSGHTFGIPNLYVGLAAIAALVLFTGRKSGYRAARREAISKVRAQYPTYGGRLRRGVAAV